MTLKCDKLTGIELASQWAMDVGDSSYYTVADNGTAIIITKSRSIRWTIPSKYNMVEMFCAGTNIIDYRNGTTIAADSPTVFMNQYIVNYPATITSGNAANYKYYYTSSGTGATNTILMNSSKISISGASNIRPSYLYTAGGTGSYNLVIDNIIIYYY